MPVRPNPAINRATSGDASSVQARQVHCIHLHDLNVFLVSFDCIIHLGSALCKKWRQTSTNYSCILDQIGMLIQLSETLVKQIPNMCSLGSIFSVFEPQPLICFYRCAKQILCWSDPPDGVIRYDPFVH